MASHEYQEIVIYASYGAFTVPYPLSGQIGNKSIYNGSIEIRTNPILLSYIKEGKKIKVI